MSNVVTVGEAMLELRPDGGAFAATVAGDAFNTAARLAAQGHAVRHVQDLGEDMLADRIRAECERRSVRLAGRVHPDRCNGMYLVSADPGGERRFQYHRAGSAAGETLLGPGAEEELVAADLLYVTGVTLAVSADRGRLTERLRSSGRPLAVGLNVRDGLHSRSPDGVLRPVDRSQIVGALEALLPAARVVFGSAAELSLIGGGEPASRVAARIASGGGRIVVVTDGARGASCWHGSEVEQTQWTERVDAVDTAGAGDALAAGFLDAMLAGRPLGDCLRAGVEAGRDAVLHAGALPPLTAA